MATRKDTNLRKRELELSVRGACASGEWAPGDPVPPVRELAARHGLSLSVVNQALRKMVEDGLLDSVPRVGTFVGSAKPPQKPGFLNNTIVQLRRQRNLNYATDHLVSGISDAMHEAISESISAAGMDVLALPIDRLLDDEKGVEELARVAAQKPYGVAMSTYFHSEPQVTRLAEALTAQGVPTVIYDDLGNFDRVVSNHESGAYQLTRWLLERGHRRIRQIWEGGVPRGWMVPRRRGYERAMREAGLEPRPAVDLPSYSEWRSIHAFEEQVRGTCGSLLDVLRGPDPDDALMAPSDGTFFVLAGVCRMLGLEPNQDVAIVGYDNYWRDSPHLSALQCAPLATVEKFNVEAGRALVRLLIDRVEGRLPAGPQRVMLEPEIVVIQQESVSQVTQVRDSLAAERAGAMIGHKSGVVASELSSPVGLQRNLLPQF